MIGTMKTHIKGTNDWNIRRNNERTNI